MANNGTEPLRTLVTFSFGDRQTGLDRPAVGEVTESIRIRSREQLHAEKGQRSSFPNGIAGKLEV